MLIWIHSPRCNSRRFLFLDRDGVINVDRTDYIKHWGEFHFYPDALEALRSLHAKSINVILISNQSALNRGLISRQDFWDVHERMIRCVREAGGEILAALYCPHRPEEKCSCRKPSPGMILAASRLYDFPLETTHMIGDRHTDVLAANQAGCQGILLERSSAADPPVRPLVEGPESSRYTTLPDAVMELFGT
jgi:D-glycero-D-manno-heptose 1,7-bisphosphate phosphatase